MSRLKEIGKAWKHPGSMAKLNEHVVITTRNLATGKPIHASSYPDGVGPDEANDGDFRSSWYLDEGQASGWLEVDLRKQESFNVVSLVEPVGRWDDYPQSRIRSYRFQHWNGARWITLTGGETPAPTTDSPFAFRASQRRGSGYYSRAARRCPILPKLACMTNPLKRRPLADRQKLVHS